MIQQIPVPVALAARAVRLALGDTPSKFGKRIGRTTKFVRFIEADVCVPDVESLITMQAFAREAGVPMPERIFEVAVAASVPVPARVS